MTRRTLRIGTRGSPLALCQAELVRQRLATVYPRMEWEIVPIRTRGDERPAAPIATLGEGAFVKAIEQALVDGHIDLAVHSLKDVPVQRAEPAAACVLAAFPERADPRDALVTRDGRLLEHLPRGACIATGSPRRAAQLLALRPDLRIVEVRGNVETRLRKLEEGACDALVLAAAGLARLGLLGRVSQYFDPAQLTPAVGQGALAVQCRKEDSAGRELLSAIDDAGVRGEVVAERSMLAALGGGCRTPAGALGRSDGNRLAVTGVLCQEDGLTVRAQVEGTLQEAEQLGRELAARLLRQAAAVHPARPVHG